MQGMRMSGAVRRWTLSIVASFVLSGAANAADLVIALKDPPPTMDPHFMTTPAAGQINSQIFEPLVSRDSENVPRAKLAERWDIVDDKTWVFHLRKNVKFSDGSPFTAKDVVFTFDRIPKVPNAPSSFVTYLSQIDRAEVIDDYTLKVTTKAPAPTLLENLAVVLIVSRNSEGAGTNDYNSGKAQIGTGPYKFSSWSLNDNTVLVKNPGYWGEKPVWDKVTYRMIVNDAPRLASLLAGDSDVIEAVPIVEMEKLKSNPNVKVWTRETTRIVYMSFDTSEESIAGGKITGPNGEKLDRNPFTDIRLRKAMKMALDLDAFVAKIYLGGVVPTGQFIGPGLAAFNPDVKPWKQDVEGARKLLAESGWAGKLKLDLAVSAQMFPNAVQVAEGMAQSWTRIGIPTSVTQTPYPVFLEARNKRQVPIFVSQYQNQAGSAEFLTPTLLHTRAGSYGTLNLNRYSNPKFDRLVEDALSTMDDGKRAKLLQEATTVVIDDTQTIPMWLLSEHTGTKSSLTFTPRKDRLLLPNDFKPAK